jgi:5-formyltetrahydrofolate cyclo-ligase
VVLKRLQSLKSYQDAKRISVFLSMPSSEIQTDAIVRHALISGKKVFVPYLYKPITPAPNTPKSLMEMVDLSSLSDYESLNQDSWGIPTISADTVHHREHILKSPKENLGLDMILMPGVAFDVDPETGSIRRLGHGKGFYDYFLYRYMQITGSHIGSSTTTRGSDVLLYGLALEEQLLKAADGCSIPVGEYDHLLHGLLVGDGSFLTGPSSRQ